MSPLEPCCYECVACGAKACRDDRPSPGEAVDICAPCFEVEAEVLEGDTFEFWLREGLRTWGA